MLEEGSNSRPTARHDWSGCPLGAPPAWPYPLRLAVDLVLGMPAPVLLVWGRERLVFMNDAYARVAATRSARAPGGTVPALLPAPLSAAMDALEQALQGRASMLARQAIPFIRDSGIDMLEFDLHFTPVPDEAGRPAGALCALGIPGAPAAPSAGALHILVVEDNLDAQYLVCEMLRALGHQVDGTGRAEDALPLLAHARYDLLFSDVSLPGMSGVELARRALAAQPGLRVIFASGYGDTLLRHINFPYTGLQKPYDLEQLQAALARAAAGAP